jgi:predicted lipoprotein with Yx(FWY)xxD motif
VKAGIAIAWSVVSCLPATALAQPADLPIPAATTSSYPPGVTVGRAGGAPVYVGPAGRTLYGMDMRTLLREGPDPSQYCRGECAEIWEPLLAPAGAKVNVVYPGVAKPAVPPPAAPLPNQKAPDWTVIHGAQGPQWVYKGWHMVFTRKGERAGAAAHEGEEDRRWNTLKFVPPVPVLTVPVNVGTAFLGGAYALIDSLDRLLFCGTCAKNCTWQPFAGGLANRGLGEWTVLRDGDGPQWAYRGKRVYVAESANAADLPRGAAVLRP